MASLNLTTINTGITDTLADATGLIHHQDYDELTEGMQNLPNIQVYWKLSNQDLSGNTSMTTFKGAVRQTDITFYADLYARQRSHIGEDMAALLPLVDAITDVLEEQTSRPYFGVTGIDAILGWQAEQVVFNYGDVDYVGARFTIRLRVF